LAHRRLGANLELDACGLYGRVFQNKPLLYVGTFLGKANRHAGTGVSRSFEVGILFAKHDRVSERSMRVMVAEVSPKQVVGVGYGLVGAAQLSEGGDDGGTFLGFRFRD
jgi:hypothetical protein